MTNTISVLFIITTFLSLLQHLPIYFLVYVKFKMIVDTPDLIMFVIS